MARSVWFSTIAPSLRAQKSPGWTSAEMPQDELLSQMPLHRQSTGHFTRCNIEIRVES